MRVVQAKCRCGCPSVSIADVMLGIAPPLPLRDEQILIRYKCGCCARRWDRVVESTSEVVRLLRQGDSNA
jgi:hypothetical protein